MSKFWKIFFIIIGSLIILGILGFCFYWFEYRPSKIKHDCSWVKQHQNYWPGISREKADKDNTECTKARQDYKNKNPNNHFTDLICDNNEQHSQNCFFPHAEKC